MNAPVAPEEFPVAPPPDAPIAAPPPPARFSRLRRFLLFTSLGALACAAIVVALLWKPIAEFKKRADAINLEELSNYNETNLFFDRDDQELGRIFVENRVVLSHDDIPDLMRKAVIAIEDERFYKHHGLDFQGLFRAMLTNVRQMRFAQGGSTLTQQLSKHLIGTFEKSLDRKIIEAFLAVRIERAFDKEAILDFYLNRIYFGKGYFGIEAAAQGYFGKRAKDLALGECAMLAGIIKAPNRWSPRRDFITARFRRNVALEKMEALGFITAAQHGEARATKIVVQPPAPSLRANFFTTVVTRELTQALGLDEDESPQGLRVYTTFDKRLQEAAETALRAELARIEAEPPVQERMLVAKLPDDSLEGAALVTEARTGEIRVLIGGRDFQKNQFEHVTMARRENGALLQPLVYALAFQDLDLHPASMINATFINDPTTLGEEEVALGDPDRDLKARFLTIRDAIALGNQASATRVGLQLGQERINRLFAQAGVGEIASNRADTVWNMSPLTLWETVSLYQALANSGQACPLHTIRRIENSQGAVLFSREQVASKPLLDPVVAQQMTLTLEGVTREGIGRSLSLENTLPVPAVGMPGYSSGYRDAWFVGYTTDLVGGVWVGFDKSIPIGDKTSAAGSAIPLWSSVMQRILAEEEEPRGGEFPVPKDQLSKVEVDRRTGEAKGLAHLNPAPGHIFVYLRQSQLNAARKPSAEVAANLRETDDWSDWFGSLFASSMDQVGTSDIPNPDDYSGDVIPRVAEYRIPGLRGNIVSADGVLLATMEQLTALVLPWPGPDVAPTPDEAVAWAAERLDAAAQWLGTSNSLAVGSAELRTRYHFQRFHPIPVADRLSREQIEAFPRSPLAERGFTLQEFPLRVYPEGPLASHTIGYLKRSQGRNWGRYQADEVICDDYAGASGLELVYNGALVGKPGKFTLTTTPDGFCQKAVVADEPGFGATLLTTINARLQREAERALSPTRRGAIVVLNVNTGDTVALASWPGFNPNDFLPTVSPEMWQGFVTSRLNPLLHRCYRQPNPPGSTFKTVTAVAAFQAGTFDPNRTVNANGCYRVGNIEYNLPRETRPVSFHEALTLSFNSYFMDTGLRAGRDNLIRTAFDMGIGQPTGIPLPEENPGLFPTPEFVLRTHQRNMGNGDVANASIGQGDVLVTPIQMANWMAAIANGGALYRPRIVSALVDEQGRVLKQFPPEIFHKANVSAETLAPLRDAMVSVVEKGTAKQAQVPGVRVAGKTGTAQVGSKRKPRQIAWFGGYLPADNPELAFAVMVEGDTDQDLHGGSDAGMVAGNMFRSYYGVQPANKTAANP